MNINHESLKDAINQNLQVAYDALLSALIASDKHERGSSVQVVIRARMSKEGDTIIVEDGIKSKMPTDELTDETVRPDWREIARLDRGECEGQTHIEVGDE